MAPAHGALENAGGGQGHELLLHRSERNAGFSGDFPDVEALVGAAEEQGQDLAAGPPEERVGQKPRPMCSHNENNCILIENGRRKGSGLTTPAVAIRVGALHGRHPELEAQAHRRLAAALTTAGRLYIDGGSPLREVRLRR